jgi:RHS repeat-associated protein
MALPRAATLQEELANERYDYDALSNIKTIHDLRDPSMWPEGATPVRRDMAYDGFNRLTGVTLSHTNATQRPILRAIDGAALPTRTLATRLAAQTFAYDWKGNLTGSTDDKGAFFERSLTNNVVIEGGPHQFRAAGPALQSGSASQEFVNARYDAAGNVIELRVNRATCDAQNGLCAHRFLYDWDETGKLVRARRWDSASLYPSGPMLPAPPEAIITHPGPEPLPAAAPDADLRYVYSGMTRVLKSIATSAGEKHTVEVFSSLRLNRADWDGTDYERTADTETAYLGGLGRVVAGGGRPRTLSSVPHVFLTIGDHLGSTNAVIDQATSELVSATTYQPFGKTESDYRPDRWGAHREDFRFTGKEEDLEVGLTFFGARYYNASIGRWMSADPKTIQTGGADWNPYAYVYGSPTNLVDPLGLDAIQKDKPNGGSAWGSLIGWGISVVCGLLGCSGGTGGSSSSSASSSGGGGYSAPSTPPPPPPVVAAPAVATGASGAGPLHLPRPNPTAVGFMLGIAQGALPLGALTIPMTDAWVSAGGPERQFFHGAGLAIGGTMGVLNGIGGEVGGFLLDATGIGAVVGVPVNIISAVMIANGALAVGFGIAEMATSAPALLAKATPGATTAKSGAGRARPAPAKDNWRGRYNAQRAAEGKSRLPEDWDAHHRIPRAFKDHPEFKDFDFHDPSNIRGVKGSSADVNIHQKITNEWEQFQRQSPDATRSQIEDFARGIDAKYDQHWWK